jgi:hypothetical protein
MRMVGASILDKFVAHTYPEPNTGCWLWAGYQNGYGYGVIWIKHKPTLAHRFSFEHHKQQKLGKMFACHKCNNTYCVNPDHLYAGTQKMNMRQAYDQGRFGRNLYPEKPISQIDFDGNVIANYKSIMEATRITGFKQPPISRACKDKFKSAYGYKWAFILPDQSEEVIEEPELATV